MTVMPLGIEYYRIAAAPEPSMIAATR